MLCCPCVQVLSAGLQPNLVTYNTLLEVYAKRGMWREAVGVLDTLEQQVGMTSSFRLINFGMDVGLDVQLCSWCPPSGRSGCMPHAQAAACGRYSAAMWCIIGCLCLAPMGRILPAGRAWKCGFT